MSQEQHHHHHLFHRHKDEDDQNVGSGGETYGYSEQKTSSYPEQGAYGSSGYENPTESTYDTGAGGTYGSESAGGGAFGSSGYTATETAYGEQVTETGVGYGSAATDSPQEDYERAKKEEKHHKRLEHVGELGAVAAGGYALYEKHEAKKDPEHAHRHKIEEEVAAAAAVGAGGFAFHEHHEKKESKEEEEEAGGKHHRHHLF